MLRQRGGADGAGGGRDAGIGAAGDGKLLRHHRGGEQEEQEAGGDGGGVGGVGEVGGVGGVGWSG